MVMNYCDDCGKQLGAYNKTGLCRSCRMMGNQNTKGKTLSLSKEQIRIKSDKIKGSKNPSWNPNPNASTQTQRCHRIRGPAKNRKCVRCIEDGVKKPAHDWAHVHGQPGNNVWTDFVALCRPCHMQYDGHGKLSIASRKANGNNSGWRNTGSGKGPRDEQGRFIQR